MEEKVTMREKVLGAIHAGRVKMRPRWHFVLKTILAISGTVIIMIVLLYVASFILFVLRQSGVWFAPGFGLRGFFVFLRSLPWILISASIVFVVIFEILVKRYAFAFKRPVVYSVLGILLFVVIGGFVVARTQLHQSFFIRAQQEKLPVAGSFYRSFGMHRFPDIHPGTIASTTDDGFILLTPRAETLTIVVTPNTRLPFGFDFGEGDAVVVFGRRQDTTIRAFGIRKIDAEIMMNPQMIKKISPPHFRRQFRPRFEIMK